MSFKVPEKRRDRIAVARLLAVALPGIAFIAWLLVQSLANIPPALFDGTFGETASPLAQWGVDVTHLLLVIPLGAAVVLFARLVVGLNAFGIFTPMLLALALVQMGPIFGLLMLGVAMVIGVVVVPLLEKMRQPRMAMMAVLIGLVVTLLYGFMRIAGPDFSPTPFPVVVTALVIERWWVSRKADGPEVSSELLLTTALIAVAIQFILVSPVLKWGTQAYPFALPFLGTALALALGSYRGLRLSELFRFRPILEDPDERPWD